MHVQFASDITEREIDSVIRVRERLAQMEA
jgi:hypothetical protein